MNDEMRKRVGYLPEDHGQTFSRAVRTRSFRGNKVLELRGLTRRYGDVLALDDVSFTLGELITAQPGIDRI
jgi:hypothetical protein